MPNWTLYEGDCLEVMRELPSSHALTNTVSTTGAPKSCGLSPPPDGRLLVCNRRL